MARAEPCKAEQHRPPQLITINFIYSLSKFYTMDIVFYFVASSMQDRRALIKYLLTMEISFFYDGDTERIMIDGIDEPKADKIAQGAKTWGAESPIRVEADYLTF